MALISPRIKFNPFEKEIIRENSVSDNLKKLSETTGYSINQRNGQRVYGPPPNWEGDKPPKGSEIFVGKIPRDIFEDELVPLFEQVGKIYELRLMMDFSGFNRGFCFVTYCDIKSADEAVKRFNGFDLRPKRKLGVYKSVDNCRLFIGGLPKDKKKEEIMQALNEQVEGIMDVILYSSQYDNNENRGFAFVEFENHRYAAMARRQLAPGAFQLWGADIVVDWADPLPTLDPTIMAQVTNLYIRNICVFMDTQAFFNEIMVYIPSIRIYKIHKVLDYAFVHFRRRVDAEIALNTLNGVQIGGHQIEVTWARPKIYSKSYRMNTPPTNFCTSLPPIMRRQVKALTAHLKEGSKNHFMNNNSVNGSTSSDNESLNFGSSMEDLDNSYRNEFYSLQSNEIEEMISYDEYVPQNLRNIPEIAFNLMHGQNFENYPVSMEQLFSNMRLY